MRKRGRKINKLGFRRGSSTTKIICGPSTVHFGEGGGGDQFCMFVDFKELG